MVHTDWAGLKKADPYWTDFKWKASPRINKFISVSDITATGLKQTHGYDSEVIYNILDLESYYTLDDEYTVMSYINTLICCEKELIILDTKNYLKQEINSLFIKKIKDLFKYKLPKPVLQDKSVIKKISDLKEML